MVLMRFSALHEHPFFKLFPDFVGFSLSEGATNLKLQ